MNNETKTNINWYPGHMAKTKKQIIEDLKLIDVAVEILDARIPFSSQNPDIKKWIQGKYRLVVLNKCDLADEIENERWVEYFEKIKIPVVLVNSLSGKGVENVIHKIKSIYENNAIKDKTKGRVGKSIRVMVLGIPNVGKSSFINRITKKSSAQVGNRPGVTRQKQWIRINKDIELLDTPGILWPKFEDEEVGLKLSYTGAIKDDILQTIEIGFYLLKYLLNQYKSNVIERFNLDKGQVEKILNEDIEENEKVLKMMDEIGNKRGALMSGGKIDQEKVAKIIIDDFRNGKMGRITLDILPT